MDGVRHFMGDCDIWCRYENTQSQAATKMDGLAVFDYGLGVDIYTAGDGA